MTEGTWWELETIIRDIDPRRLIMIVPSPLHRLSAYRALRERFMNLMPVALPDTAEDFNLVIFDKNWEPEFLKYKIHEGFGKLFLANGLDLTSTLKPFTERLEKFDKSNNQPANYPSRRKMEFKANMLSILVAVTCLTGVFYVGEQYKAVLDKQKEAWDTCQYLVSRMSEINDLSDDELLPYPSTWIAYVRRIRTFFGDEDNAACLKIDRKEMLSKFESDVRNPPEKFVTAWIKQAEKEKVPVKDVTDAIQLTGNSQLLAKWTDIKKGIEVKRHSNTILLNIRIRYADKDMKSDLLSDIEEKTTSHVTYLIDDYFSKLIPAPYVVRLASRLNENEDLSLYTQHINVNLVIGFAEFGKPETKLINILLPINMSAKIDVTANDLYPKGVFDINDIRSKIPTGVTYDQINQQIEKQSTMLVHQLTNNITPQRIGCMICEPITYQ